MSPISNSRVEPEENFEVVAEKIRSLDNPVKLKILDLLIREGEKSITDIAKILDLNFSTAHKYLEQMEGSKLVSSRQVIENRAKRSFKVNNFNLNLTPSAFRLSEPKETGKEYRIINTRSKEETFSPEIFINSCVELGVPMDLMNEVFAEMKNKMYDGVTALEIESSFNDLLKKKQALIEKSLELIQGRGVFKSGTIIDELKRRNNPTLMAPLLNGEIHLENLSTPRLFNFSHDLGLLTMLGIEKQPKSLKDFLEQLSTLINQINYIAEGNHILGTFNYYLTIFSEDLTKEQIKSELVKFFDAHQDKALFVELEIGTPRFFKDIKKMLLQFEHMNSGQFAKYLEKKDDSDKVREIVLEVLKDKKFSKITPVLKFWKDWSECKSVDVKENYLLVNMIPDWQTSNACYSSSSRFDCRWKYLLRTIRVGENQNIVINVPRIALENKTEEAFFKKLDSLLNSSYELLLISSEVMHRVANQHQIMLQKIKYNHFDDCAYSISLCGVEEAVKLLTGKDLKTNMAFAKKIISHCNKYISQKSGNILRLDIKENDNELIAKRFHRIDSNKFEVPFGLYSTGVSKYNPHLELHREFLGGHCSPIAKKEINLKKLLELDWGMIKVSEHGKTNA